MSEIRFYTKRKISNKKYPYIYLLKDNWNDYWTYVTLFHCTYFANENESHDLGSLKILDKRPGNGNTVLPDEFFELDDNYCSLGTDIEYYKNIKDYINDFEDSILVKLNDIAYFPSIAEEFERHDGFKTSLLRYSEAEKAYKQAKKYLTGIDYKEAFKFNYRCRIENAEDDHVMNFNFSESDNLPHRIIAIIGRNGTGKTQFLSNLALDLSGQKRTKKNIGEFLPQRPLFSKIIAVSYSVFDKFVRPSKEKTFSYKYCGLRDSKGLISQNKLDESYEQAIELIVEYKRERIWHSVLSKIIPAFVLNEFYDVFFDDGEFSGISAKIKQKLSSGQSILMFIFTEIIANIRDESLILFDEPEMHLHPNAISNVVSSLNVLLNKFDSYAVLATHSPIIIQELVSDNVYVFEREGSIPIVRVLDIESFGENISTITKHVFETIEVQNNFKKHLKKISKELTYDEVLNLFHNKLSFNASMYLKGLYNKTE